MELPISVGRIRIMVGAQGSRGRIVRRSWVRLLWECSEELKIGDVGKDLGSGKV